MNKLKESIVWSFIVALMIFTVVLMIIMIIYIVNRAFIESETILAGLIGFIGAIIGGIVTYRGVLLTINEQRNKENQIKSESASHTFLTLFPKIILIKVAINNLNEKDFEKQKIELLKYINEFKELKYSLSRDIDRTEISFKGQLNSLEFILENLEEYISSIKRENFEDAINKLSTVNDTIVFLNDSLSKYIDK